jgi:hypothetical protein
MVVKKANIDESVNTCCGVKSLTGMDGDPLE